MILVLAGLEMTSNDVHSRLTKVSRPVFRPGMGNDSTKTAPMQSMQFASRSLMSDNLKSHVQTSELTSTVDATEKSETDPRKTTFLPDV